MLPHRNEDFESTKVNRSAFVRGRILKTWTTLENRCDAARMIQANDLECGKSRGPHHQADQSVSLASTPGLPDIAEDLEMPSRGTALPSRRKEMRTFSRLSISA